MIKVFKVTATILILLGAGLFMLRGIAITASSHNISMESRNTSMMQGIGAVIIGAVLIVAVWLPWNRIRKS
jgi:hypothetical protein